MGPADFVDGWAVDVRADAAADLAPVMVHLELSVTYETSSRGRSLELAVSVGEREMRLRWPVRARGAA